MFECYAHVGESLLPHMATIVHAHLNDKSLSFDGVVPTLNARTAVFHRIYATLASVTAGAVVRDAAASFIVIGVLADAFSLGDCSFFLTEDLGFLFIICTVGFCFGGNHNCRQLLGVVCFFCFFFHLVLLTKFVLSYHYKKDTFSVYCSKRVCFCLQAIQRPTSWILRFFFLIYKHNENIKLFVMISRLTGRVSRATRATIIEVIIIKISVIL